MWGNLGSLDGQGSGNALGDEEDEDEDEAKPSSHVQQISKREKELENNEQPRHALSPDLSDALRWTKHNKGCQPRI